MPPRPVITLTTDFGEGSRYVAAMKGVILSINPEALVVDITHSVPPQDVLAGARVLADATRWYAPGSIHVAVIDPGVGTAREIVYSEFDGRGYVCPDNGLLTNLADHRKPHKMVAVENAELWLPRVSATFHGRDIMAPVAAHLSLGVPPDRLGPRRCEPLSLPTKQAIAVAAPAAGDDPSREEGRVGQRIEGEVVEVDSFGNLITNISEEMLQACPRDASVTIRCDEHETFGIYQTYGEQPAMTLVALVGSGGALELAIVDDSAKIMLGVGVGAPVAVSW
ncbi:MAG: SAM-dependent chlorinase/fluorinase [Planctomycetota bacterium]